MTACTAAGLRGFGGGGGRDCDTNAVRTSTTRTMATLGVRAALFLWSAGLASVVSSTDSGCHSECDECALQCPLLKSCCRGACCITYDENSREVPGLSQHTAYAVHSVFFNWTALYFWFIVIFLVVSCVGGCGYWRWRHVRCASSDHFPGRRRRRCGSHTPIQEEADGDEEDEAGEIRGSTAHHHHHRHHHQGAGPSYAEAYHQPLRFVPTSRLRHQHHPPPPPYSEVTSKPDMYPLVQGGLNFKNDPLAFLYATTPLIHTYMPYNSAMTYLASPAESNSSLFHSNTTASNCVFPPPYSDGYHAASGSLVSTPGSLMSVCTPTEHSGRATYFLSSVSPPMATTPTSLQILSEVTTPADSLASPTLFRFAFFGDGGGSATDVMGLARENAARRRSNSGGGSMASSFTRHGEAQLATLVADIQSMTNRVMRHGVTSSSTNDDDENSSITDLVRPTAISPSEGGEGNALCRSISTTSTCSSSSIDHDQRSAQAEAGSEAGAPWTPGGDSQCATDTGGSLASVSSGDFRSRRSSSGGATVADNHDLWRTRQIAPRSPPRTLPVTLAYVSSEAGTNTSPMTGMSGSRTVSESGSSAICGRRDDPARRQQ